MSSLRMGAAGRRFVEGWASPAAVAERTSSCSPSFASIVAELVAARR